MRGYYPQRPQQSPYGRVREMNSFDFLEKALEVILIFLMGTLTFAFPLFLILQALLGDLSFWNAVIYFVVYVVCFGALSFFFETTEGPL